MRPPKRRGLVKMGEHHSEAPDSRGGPYEDREMAPISPTALPPPDTSPLIRLGRRILIPTANHERLVGLDRHDDTTAADAQPAGQA